MAKADLEKQYGWVPATSRGARWAAMTFKDFGCGIAETGSDGFGEKGPPTTTIDGLQLLTTERFRLGIHGGLEGSGNGPRNALLLSRSQFQRFSVFNDFRWGCPTDRALGK